MPAPHITVTADYESGRALGSPSLLSLGLGMHQLWMYALLCGYGHFFGLSSFAPLEKLDIGISLAGIVSTAVFCASLLFFAATDQRFLKLYVSKQMPIAGSGCMMAGVVFSVLSPFLGPVGGAAEVIAGLFTGWGSAAVLFCWGIAFARVDAMSIALNGSLAIFFAIAVYMVMLNFIPVVASELIMFATPAAECAILLHKTPEPFFERREWPKFDALAEKKVTFCLMVSVPMVFLGFTLCVLGQSALQTALPDVGPAGAALAILAAFCSVAFVLVTCMAVSNSTSWEGLLRMTVVCVAAGSLLLLSVQAGEFSIGSFLTLFCYASTESLVWVFFAEFAHRYKISPVLVFSIGCGSLTLGRLLGIFAPLVSEALAAILPYGSTSIVVLVFVFVVGACVTLPDEAALARCVSYKPAGDTILATELLRDDEDGADREEEEGEEKRPVGYSLYEDVSAWDSSEDSDNDEEGSDKPDHISRGGKRWFHANCQLVTDIYMLSRRESEVLNLLAKGFNAAAIQKKLYISEGTAKTHIRHIYRKLDVHSQQELIRLVETIDKEQ